MHTLTSNMVYDTTLETIAYTESISAYMQRVHGVTFTRDSFDEFQKQAGIKYMKSFINKSLYMIVDARKFQMARLKYGF